MAYAGREEGSEAGVEIDDVDHLGGQRDLLMGLGLGLGLRLGLGLGLGLRLGLGLGLGLGLRLGLGLGLGLGSPARWGQLRQGGWHQGRGRR